MQVYTTLIKTFKLPLVLVAVLTLASCGSYQYAGYDQDGIYNSEGTGSTYEEAPQDRNSNGYYANLFAEKSNQYEAVPQENAVFIDVEAYS